FLLTVPFAVGFRDVGGGGRVLYYVALFGAALASICFIAPVTQHRILFRLGQKPLLIRRANRFGICGAVALAVSITAATALIMQTLLSAAVAAVGGAAIAALCAWAWFVQPLLSRGAVLSARGRSGGGGGDGALDAAEPPARIPAEGSGAASRATTPERDDP
ncbi:MAG: hypothetical protein IRY90_07810, partial [Actinomadura rubrobrunea]|nr:hypothetical protein [Actinomadura rubrobrunea]